MKKAFPVLVICLVLAGCATQEARGPARIDDFVGTYVAEHVIDTVEELALRADGSFTFHFLLVGDKDSWYEGRWKIRDDSVVLLANDEEGREVEFPLVVDRGSKELALVYSHESHAQAKAAMVLPNSFRRVSKTPNLAPEPMPRKRHGSP